MKIIASINCLLLLVVGAQGYDHDGPTGRDALAAGLQTVIDAKITPPQTSFLGGALNSAKYFFGFDCDEYTYKLEAALTVFLPSGTVESISQADVDTSVGLMQELLEDFQAAFGPFIDTDTWSASITEATSEGIRGKSTMVVFDDDDDFVPTKGSIQFDVDFTVQMDGAHFFSEMEMNELFVNSLGSFIGFGLFSTYPDDVIWGNTFRDFLYSCQERDDICLQNTR